jgi:hypothetical protein
VNACAEDDNAHSVSPTASATASRTRAPQARKRTLSPASCLSDCSR